MENPYNTAVIRLYKGETARIGDWLGSRWLIIKDAHGQEIPVRIATAEDIANHGIHHREN